MAERTSSESLPDEAPHEQRAPESMVVPKRSDDSAGSEVQLEEASLSYHLLVPHAAHAVQRELFDDAYRCWRTVWGQTLRELDGADGVFSDDFTRQHELGGLFYAGQCVGLTGYRFIDLTLAASREDSYFKIWPQALLEQITDDARRVCVGSNLTVLPRWRGLVGGHSVKEILMALAVERFLASDADAMLGTMRNDRGMNGLVYRLGARALVQNVSHHGVQVDLVSWRRAALGAIEPRPATAVLTRELWRDSQRRQQHEERTG